MTDHTNTMTTGFDDAHALSGAYAVDALDAAERTRFEVHLTGCADCRAEVDSLRETAALLGIEDEVAPPADLRNLLLAGIAEIRPLPPEVATDTTDSSDTTDAPIDLSARRRVLRRLPMLVAAAAVVLLLAVVTVWQPWPGNDDEPQLTATEQVLQADDASTTSLGFPDGSGADVVLSRSEGRAVIQTHDMAPAPSGQVYQIWLETPEGDMLPAGLMPDDPDTTLLLDGDASEATGVGITVEPDGGSDAPTSDPIALFELEA